MREQPVCDVRWLGCVDYVKAWHLQRGLVRQRQEGRVPDQILLLEHDAVYTYGHRGARGHFLTPPPRLRSFGARVLKVDRGGGLTFHGPGQLVGYPILDLREWQPDLHLYLRALEGVLITVLADYGIAADRLPGLTGVWVEGRKIAAIGVKVSRWVTSHGFALNVGVDLQWFRHIVACGIDDRGVTSMQAVLGQPLPLAPVAATVVRRFGEAFGRPLIGNMSDFLAVPSAARP
jgi:lipoyl(octanoyl) transferase